MGICMSVSNDPSGFSAGDGGFKPLDGRRRALDIFTIDTNFKRVVYKKQAKTRELLTDKLSNHPLFDKLDKKELGELVDAMKSINLPRNQALVSRGDAMNEMYILEIGELTGFRAGGKGKKDKTKVFTPGAVIGDKALLSEQTSQATVQCSSNNAAIVWVIDAGTYRNVLASNGERVTQRKRVRTALAACPALYGLSSSIIDKLADDAERPKSLPAGSPIPQLAAKQPCNELWIVTKGMVLETMSLRQEGGLDMTKKKRKSSVTALLGSSNFDPSSYVLSERGYEATEGQLVGIMPLVCEVPYHLGSAVASRGGADVVSIPLEGIVDSLNKSVLAMDLIERLLTTRVEFAAFPQAVVKILVSSMPVRKYAPNELLMRQGDSNKFMFIVRRGKLCLKHADRTVVMKANTIAAMATQEELDQQANPVASPSKSRGGPDEPGRSRKKDNSGRRGSSKGSNRSSNISSISKNATEEEILEYLRDEIPNMYSQANNMPPRFGIADSSDDEVRNQLSPGDCFGVSVMKPISTDKAEAAKRAEAGEDGSVVMQSSLIAVNQSEVCVLSRDVFMRALNLSRQILKRRKKDRDMKAARAAAAQAGDGRGSMRASLFGGGNKKKVPKEAVDDIVAREGGVDTDSGTQLANGLPELTSQWAWQSRPDLKLSNLREVKILGKGAFGLVRCVRDKGGAGEFALKALALPALKASSGGRGLEKIIRERDAQVICGTHPMVCGLVNTYEDSKSLYILMNLESGKELFEILYRSESTKSGTNPVGLDYAKFLVANLVLGMGHVHAQGFMFRDLKPENIMVNRNGYCKLIDFGFAKLMPPGDKSFTLCGTAEYLAPELVLGTGHNHAVDWWTVGIVAFELRCGKTPFDADKEDDEDNDEELTKEQIVRKRRNAIMSNIVSKKLKIPKERFSEEAGNFLKRILNRDPVQRLGSYEAGDTASVRECSWLSDIDWEGLLDQTIQPPRLR